MKVEMINLHQLIDGIKSMIKLDLIPLEIYDITDNIILTSPLYDINNNYKVYSVILDDNVLVGKFKSPEIYKDILLTSFKYQFNLNCKVRLNEYRIWDSKVDISNVKLLKSALTENSSSSLITYLKTLRISLMAEIVQVYEVNADLFLDQVIEVSNKGDCTKDFSYDLMDIVLYSLNKKESLVYSSDELRSLNISDDSVRNVSIIPISIANKNIGALVFANSSDLLIYNKNNINLLHCSSLISRIINNNNLLNTIQEVKNHTESLSKYVSSKMKELDITEEVTMGGVEKSVTVMFIQIKNFQKLYKLVSPDKIMKLLNIHYECLIRVIEENGGSIDKVLGDCLMAVWNHPFDQTKHTEMAYMAAKNLMAESFSQVRPLWSKFGVPGYSIGIGINCGIVNAGNLGSQHFMDYTIIGDNVNTAQRLESFAGPWELMVSNNVELELKKYTSDVSEKINNIHLKGKSNITSAYLYTFKGRDDGLI